MANIQVVHTILVPTLKKRMFIYAGGDQLEKDTGGD